MKGDFTRDTFDRDRHFSRVLWQQGRVQLDADFNEQTSILLHRQHALAADLIGPHGTPPPNAAEPDLDGFKISRVSATDFKIGNGRYYVDGILCENDAKDEAGNFVDVTYKTQPGYAQDLDAPLPATPFLVYLDVWERHLTYVELEDQDGSAISIRESALKGPDTATRAQVVWQVKATDLLPDGTTHIPANTTCDDVEKNYWSDWTKNWQREHRGMLKATAVQTRPPSSEDPCITPPEARYRGAENQLYRVEIHRAGRADEGPNSATFKWSRDNGTVIYPIREIAEKTLTLEHLGRDGRSGLQVNDWVEVVDDDYTLSNQAGALLQVTAVDPETNIVTLNAAPEVGDNPAKHRLLRRWDWQEGVQTEGEVPVHEGTSEEDWIELENGILIQFQPAPEGSQHEYRTGDYWLIPARTATGDVEWPGPVDSPKALPPHGIDHHYAPLAIFPAGDGSIADCRNLLSRGSTGDITPAKIGALALSDYDLGRTSISHVTFDQTISDGGIKTMPIAFRPALILVSGTGQARLGGRVYGGTFSAFVDLREGRMSATCAPLWIVKYPGIYDWQSFSFTHQPYVCYANFADQSSFLIRTETITVSVNSITPIDPNMFNIELKFRRTLAAGSASRLAEFRIDLELCCLG